MRLLYKTAAVALALIAGGGRSVLNDIGKVGAVLDNLSGVIERCEPQRTKKTRSWSACVGRDGAVSWYVKRNSENKQPTLDGSQKIIENYNAFYVDPNHGDSCEDKVIYLTFDAGYENGNIAKILDALAEEKVPAAFFVLENLVKRNPELLKRMENDGHFVCNHTMKHRDMSCVDDIDSFREELGGLENLYRDTIGSEMKKYYRPPEGRFDEDNLKFADELGYTTVLWSLAYADWDNENQPDPVAAKDKLLKNTHNGAIILLHPTSDTNAKIMRELIRTWKEMGYSFGTLDGLYKKEIPRSYWRSDESNEK